MSGFNPEDEEHAEAEAALRASMGGAGPRRRWRAGKLYFDRTYALGDGTAIDVEDVAAGWSGDMGAGASTWGASILLARWLIAESAALPARGGLTALELGAGTTAAPALAAARLPGRFARVIASDGCEPLLPVMRENLERNGCAAVEAVPLAWLETPAPGAAEPVADVVLAAETMYDTVDPLALAATLSRVVARPGGVAHIALPRTGRGGDAVFWGRLDALGFDVATVDVPDALYAVDAAVAPPLAVDGDADRTAIHTLTWRRPPALVPFRGCGQYAHDGGAALERLWGRCSWRPIRRCDGRFVLRDNGAHAATLPLALAGPGALVTAHVRVRPASEGVDGVVVVALQGGGGLLCYEKPGPLWVHTFNTASGLARKVEAIGAAGPVLAALRARRTRLLLRTTIAVLECLGDPEKTLVAPAASAALRRGLARAAVGRIADGPAPAAVFELRAGTIDDKAAIAVLDAEAFMADAWVDDLLTGFLRQTARGITHALVATVEGGAVVGAVLVEKDGKVMKVVTSHEHRRRGIGGALVGAALSWLRAVRPRPLCARLHVEASNAAAVALYERMGFVADGGLLRGYYGARRDGRRFLCDL